MPGNPFHCQTIPGVLERSIEATPDKVALIIDENSFTYAQMRMHSLSLARAFVDMGVAKGDCICVVMGNRPEHVWLWFASAYIGALHVPINTANRGPFLEHQIGLTESRVVAVGAEHLEHLLRILPTVPLVQHVIVDWAGQTATALPTLPGVIFHDVADLLLTDQLSTLTLPSWRDPAGIIFTSGTTGPSKGALLSHNYMVRSATTRSLTSDDTCWSPLPLFHLNSMLVTVLSPLARGGTGALSPRFSVSRFWDQVRAMQATYISILGTMVVMIWNQAETPDDIDNTVRRMLAAPVPAEIHEPFEKRFGLSIEYGYGLTEINPMLLRPPGAPPGVSGFANPAYDVKLLDDDGFEVGPGELGEFACRPYEPHMMFEGYYRNADATVAAWKNLWFHTGDLGTKDDLGYFRFAGRKKDYLRRRGENVSTYEVESAMARHPAVLEAAVFGVPSEFAEDDIMAAVILKDDADPLEPRDLLEYCAENIPYFALPRYIEIVTELPRNAVGRVLKHELRDRGFANAWDMESIGLKPSDFR